MITAVDTSVLIDVLLDDPRHGDAAVEALKRAAQAGSLCICENALAEVIPVVKANEVSTFLSQFGLQFIPSSEASARVAGEMFRTYLQRGGKRGRIVPDFLIAAHAQCHADRLLARDRGYYRDYFADLALITP